MPNTTDPAAVSAAALRDALAAVAGAIDVPRPDGMTPERELAWLRERSLRAAIAAVTIEWVLKPGADVALHVRHLREEITARGAL
jgi:hypothetical protein